MVEDGKDKKTNCWIFIDNSNLFIEGQKYFAEWQKLDVPLDKRFRINIDKLIDRLINGRSMSFCSLYGSETKSLEIVWKAIKQKKIEVNVFDRTRDGKEKEVDNALSADVTEQCINNKANSKDGVFIIVSGDRDYHSCIEILFKYEWPVEVCSWSGNLSYKTRQLTNNKMIKSLITVRNLSHIIFGSAENQACYFIKYCWNNDRIPRHRTMVLKFKKKPNKEDAEKLTEELTNKLKWPCMYTWCKNDEYNIMVILSQEHFNINELVEWEGMLNVVKNWGFKTCFKFISAVQYFSTYKGVSRPEVWQYEDAFNEDKIRNYRTIVKRVRVHPKNCSSAPCRHHFRCSQGGKCGWKHNDNEKMFFKEHHGGKKGYKSKLCHNLEKRNGCKYENKPWMCPFAHNMLEAQCCICEMVGHFKEMCEKK